jgi:hypothetical protein
MDEINIQGAITLIISLSRFLTMQKILINQYIKYKVSFINKREKSYLYGQGLNIMLH